MKPTGSISAPLSISETLSSRALLSTATLLFSGLFALLLFFGLHQSTAPLIAASSDAKPESVTAPAKVAASTTMTLTSVHDTSIFEQSESSGGASPVLLAGNTSNAGVRRALLQFDLSAIPVDATIVSATLSLQVTKVGSSTPVSFTLHKMTQAWGEAGSNNSNGQGAPAQVGDATWEYAIYTATTWSTAGGDFVSTASATTNVGGIGSYVWTSPQLVNDLETWQASAAANFGWIVIGDETASRTAKFLASRESANSAERPALTVVYEVQGQPATNIYLPLIQK